MKTLKVQLLLLLIIYIRDSSCAVDTVYEIGEAIWKLHLIIDDIISRNIDDADSLPSEYYVMNRISNQMDQIHRQLDQVEEFMHPKIIHDSFKSFPFSIMIYKCIDTLELFVSSVDAYYKDFRQHMNETRSQSGVLRQFLQSIIPNIEDRIQVIRKNAINHNEFLPDHPNLLYAITDSATRQGLELCGGPQTMSSTLLQLFKIVVIAEMKANIIFTIDRIYQFPLTAGKAEWMYRYNKKQFERQFRIYVEMFALHLQLTDGIYLRACDPDSGNWIRDESFYELEGTFQTAIFQYDRMKCNHDTCNDVWLKNECQAHFYDVRSGCYGALTECADLGAMQTCVLKTGLYKFQYVNSSKMGLLGRDFNCSEDNGYVIEDGIGSEPTHTACLCDCYRTNNKISLVSMESDIKSNMVIIGVRFVRKDGILHIQPREGKLDADGHVRQYSKRWVPIPDILNIPSSRIQAINIQDRLFFLDDLSLPAGVVLTGVKFFRVTRSVTIGFAIAISGVPFDYKSGKLNTDPKFITTSQASNEKPRHVLSLQARSSAHKKFPNIPSSTNFNYILLERSRLQDDCGQSTVPLFDAVSITTQPPSPLGGIGIFHKGSKGYAGFISLRVYGIKYAKYFTDLESRCMKNGTLFNNTCSS